MSTPSIQRALAQHALVNARLGLDAVPVYRRGAEHSIEATATLSETPPETPREPHATRAGDAPSSRSGEADALGALRARYERDAPHELFATDHHSIVFGEGDPDARLMFVGEAPGAEEDRTGRPFVGRAGELLTKMIGAMGLRRDEVYIANVLKTRPPNNQTPTHDEALLCAPYLYEQIRLVNPAVLVTLGLPSSRLLLQSSETMGRLRGRWAEFRREAATMPAEGHANGEVDAAISGEAVGPIAVMPTYHPAFLLRSYTADNRAKVWADLKMVMERLG